MNMPNEVEPKLWKAASAAVKRYGGAEAAIMTAGGGAVSAIISDCGLYRYALHRPVGRTEPGDVLWVMLNPSTADATTDDPTIKRCIGFTRAWGYDSFSVGNIYGYRSTDPAVLKDLPEAMTVGEDNEKNLAALSFAAKLVICAWGTKASHRRVMRVIHTLRLHHEQLYALRITKDGHPAHPLYLPGNLLPTFFGRGATAPEAARDLIEPREGTE
jgi:hypothetical protein